MTAKQSQKDLDYKKNRIREVKREMGTGQERHHLTLLQLVPWSR